MIGSSSRRAAITALLLAASCGNPVPVAFRQSALFTVCDVDIDCAGLAVGSVLKPVCNPVTHACIVQQTAPCTMTGTDESECSDGNDCTVDTCTATVCGTMPGGSGTDCCTTASDCNDPSDTVCQAKACVNGQCGIVAAKPTNTSDGCCNVDANCGSGLTCTKNRCCGATQKYCPTTGTCANQDQCCVNSDCTAPTGGSATCQPDHTCTTSCPGTRHLCNGACVNDSVSACGASCAVCNGAVGSCQTNACTGGTCAVNIVSGPNCCTNTDTSQCPASTNDCRVVACDANNACTTKVDTMTAGCCTPGNEATECGAGLTCTNNHCCPSGQTFCGPGVCVTAGQCCSDNDCKGRANGTGICDMTTHTCKCATGFHDCGNICKSDTSVNSCGKSSCTACATGNSCQVPTCDGTKCGFAAAASTGCCTSAADCPTASDKCQMTSCVANTCMAMPIACDGGVPTMDMASRDMASAVDLATGPDQSVAELSLSGGGGCSLAPGARDARAALLFGCALVALTLAFRRRRAR